MSDGWTRSGASPASRASESDLPNSDEVFISYSHDAPSHVDAVLALSNRLRAEGFDAVLDQYEASPPRRAGLGGWTARFAKASS